MFAKFSRAAKVQEEAAPLPTAAPHEVVMPPFWELELLIAQGYVTSDALAIMALRRATPSRLLLECHAGRFVVSDEDVLRLSA